MLTPDQKVEFGKYLRGLREGKGCSLRDVQSAVDISAGYLSLVEAGSRNPPSAEFLKRLARFYGVAPAEMLGRAGRADEGAAADLELDELRRAYQFVIEDPRFQSGHSLSSEPTPDIMRFMVEMYERGTGKRLLGGKPEFSLEDEVEP